MENTIKDEKSASSIKLSICFLTSAAVWLFTPELALAAVAFGEIGLNIAENAKGIAKGITVGGYAAGTGMALFGILEMYKAGKKQGDSSYGGGLLKIIIGGIALGMGEFLGSGSATLFGTDQTSGLGELGL